MWQFKGGRGKCDGGGSNLWSYARSLASRRLLKDKLKKRTPYDAIIKIRIDAPLSLLRSPSTSAYTTGEARRSTLACFVYSYSYLRILSAKLVCVVVRTDADADADGALARAFTSLTIFHCLFSTDLSSCILRT